jgi:hypothetical protein
VGVFDSLIIEQCLFFKHAAFMAPNGKMTVNIKLEIMQREAVMI